MSIYCIYKFTNLVNGKVYIGQTSQRMDARIGSHLTAAAHGSHLIFHRALAKYGMENFKCEIIFCTFKKEDLNCYEQQFIKEYDCCFLDDSNNGYNMTRGGDAGTRSSDDARRAALARVANGTHPFMGERGSIMATTNNIKRTKAGTNPFAGAPASKRSYIRETLKIKNGTHPFAGEKGSALQQQKVKDGTHPWAGDAGSIRATKFNNNRVENGTHPFAGVNGAKLQSSLQQARLKSGTHCSQITHKCPHCGHVGYGNPMFRWHFDRCKLKDQNNK
jgi:group I intron endonuclease